MNGYSVALLIGTVILVTVIAPFQFYVLGRARRVTQKYPLFAARDEFMSLYAEGYFAKDPKLYEHYRDLCNSLIRNTRELNLKNFVTALQPLKSETKSDIRRHRQRVKDAPKEVQRAVDQLYVAMQGILLQNSTLLRLCKRNARLLSIVFSITDGAPKPVRAHCRPIMSVNGYIALDKWRNDPKLRYAA